MPEKIWGSVPQTPDDKIEITAQSSVLTSGTWLRVIVSSFSVIPAKHVSAIFLMTEEFRFIFKGYGIIFGDIPTFIFLSCPEFPFIMGKIQTILFDLDDTLFPYAGHYQIEADDAVFALVEGKFVRRDYLEVKMHMDTEYYCGRMGHDTYFDRKARYALLLERIGVLERIGMRGEDLAEQMDQKFQSALSGVRPYSDVLITLEALFATFSLGIVTNGLHKYQDKKREALGIASFISLYLCSQDVGCAKPSPLFFSRAIALSGDSPEEILVVGNDLEGDIIPARAAGMQGMLIMREGPPREGVISALDQLLSIL